MREAVRADFVSGGEPLADLPGVHQRLDGMAVACLPFVAASDQPGDDELDRAKTMPRENLGRVREDIARAVVERDDAFPPVRLRARDDVIERCAFKARRAQRAELLVESLRRHVKKW